MLLLRGILNNINLYLSKSCFSTVIKRREEITKINKCLHDIKNIIQVDYLNYMYKKCVKVTVLDKNSLKHSIASILSTLMR